MRKVIECSYANVWSEWAPTVLRAVTGLIFFMHGLQKLETGLPGITGFVASLGFPLPAVFAVLLIVAEVGGGAFLILGLLTRWAAKSLIVVSLVALFWVHLENGFFAHTGGYEFILLLLAATVSIFLTGAGKLSLDSIVFKKK